MSTSSIAARVQTWLSSTWHVKVPRTWLEACINWIQQENGSDNLTQAQINKQVFEQWLLTDLRDLEYPVLPDGILDAPKGELSGFYSIQIDSLVDVSQPAYSQLQKIRGKSTLNEEVTANNQASQKTWEAKPTRMLMLQLTDGIHQIQGMEYQPVPVLHSGLPPGTKIMVQGNIVYRLGVLLLKPENVKLLGGEVDVLLQEYSQERVLARLIGEAENPNPVEQSDHERVTAGPVDELGQDIGPSDEELLASLDENAFSVNVETALESGYCSRSDSSNTTTPSLTSSSGNCSQQRFGNPLPGANKEPSVPAVEYVDGDLDGIALEEALFLEEEIQQELEEIQRVQPLVEDRNVSIITEQLSNMPRTSCISSLNCMPEKDGKNERVYKLAQCTREHQFLERELSVGSKSNTNNFSPQHSVWQTHNFTADLSLENPFEQEAGSKVDLVKSVQKPHSFSDNIPLNNGQVNFSKNEPQLAKQEHNVEAFSSKATENCRGLDLHSPPFTYISVLLANKPETVTTVKLKAFIVTLTGNLTSNNGFWSVLAKISDGTSYLEVNFADEILTSLIGFSVPEMKMLKKDPALHPKLKDGLQRCQRELIDLCCLMTVEFNPHESKATVLFLHEVDAVDLENLKKRLNK
ncbi:recQ-mediated genome instability protein 1 isoform X1 [Alligator sinensis]|uniref:RecQ-mediated genome instability protein 1 n=1 Tax=Alligator sinensis TaxID=38654 RepID=A0A1U7RES1_ALLSI|nr:recQ-mediated genome instability protein 1 isoform X1 [Alligator sinensis]XP_025058294.1 recQ-mediated genome instability protein 1 isoform X1 [Alligator sinensis]